jgi:hypothetical protein
MSVTRQRIVSAVFFSFFSGLCFKLALALTHFRTDIIYAGGIGLIVVGLVLVCIGFAWVSARNSRDTLMRERGLYSSHCFVSHVRLIVSFCRRVDGIGGVACC